MRYPVNLKDGGTIGFVAPSFGAFIEPYHSAFNAALAVFEGMGYKIKLGPNVYEGSGVGISSTPQNCGRELTDFMCDDTVDAVISAGGGELMCEDLDYVDFDRISRARARWYLGYSDNTNYTFLSATLCDTAALYAPCASTYGMNPWHPSLHDVMGIIRGTQDTVSNYGLWEANDLSGIPDPTAPYNCTEPFRAYFYDADGKETGDVRMSGRLLGGCLDCLTNLSGTSFDKVPQFCEKYREDGIIWFLESCDLNTMSARRALWQLKHSGWFRYTRGIIFGRPLHYEDASCGLEWEDALLEHVRDLHVPVIRNADIGHLPPMMPMICGGTAQVEGSDNSVHIRYTRK